jgi:hypothetical protein
MDLHKPKLKEVKAMFISDFAQHTDGGLTPVKKEKLAKIFDDYVGAPCIVCGETKDAIVCVQNMSCGDVNACYFYSLCQECAPCSCPTHACEVETKQAAIESAIWKARLH